MLQAALSINIKMKYIFHKNSYSSRWGFVESFMTDSWKEEIEDLFK